MVNNLIRVANVFISFGKLFHPLQLIIYFKNNIIMRHSIFLMNLEFLYHCIVSMPLISEVL